MAPTLMAAVDGWTRRKRGNRGRGSGTKGGKGDECGKGGDYEWFGDYEENGDYEGDSDYEDDWGGTNGAHVDDDY